MAPAVDPAVSSFALLGLLLLAGHAVRARVRVLRRMHLPAACIAGALGCALLHLAKVNDDLRHFFDERVADGWRLLPGFLTNVVFATLVLGADLPSPREVWRQAAPQLAFAQAVTFGQYMVVGLLSATLLPSVGYHMPRLFVVVVPVGFEGGHGVVAGMRGTFDDLGYPAGYDLGMVGATLSLVAGTILGCVLVNWAGARGHLASPAHARKPPGAAGRRLDQFRASFDGVYSAADRPPLGGEVVSVSSVNSVAFHFAVVGAVLAAGWGLKEASVAASDTSPWLRDKRLVSALPLFLFALIASVAAQAALSRPALRRVAPLCRRTMEHTCAASMDYLVASAIATLDFGEFARAAVPFLILSAAAVGWAVLFFFAAGRLLPDFWAERAATETALCLGATATALLVLRMADPDGDTPVLRVFGYKQVAHVLIVGGGFFTSSAPSIAEAAGAWGVAACGAAGCAAWLAVLVALSRRAAPPPAAAADGGGGDAAAAISLLPTGKDAAGRAASAPPLPAPPEPAVLP